MVPLTGVQGVQGALCHRTTHHYGPSREGEQTWVAALALVLDLVMDRVGACHQCSSWQNELSQEGGPSREGGWRGWWEGVGGASTWVSAWTTAFAAAVVAVIVAATLTAIVDIAARAVVAATLVDWAALAREPPDAASLACLRQTTAYCQLSWVLQSLPRRSQPLLTWLVLS